MRPKLVRDKIPQIIEANEGVKTITRTLTDREFEKELINKVREETAELALAMKDKSNIIEELADILELVKTIATHSKSSLTQVNRERLKKLKIRGGFRKRIMLMGKGEVAGSKPFPRSNQ